MIWFSQQRFAVACSPSIVHVELSGALLAATICVRTAGVVVTDAATDRCCTHYGPTPVWQSASIITTPPCCRTAGMIREWKRRVSVDIQPSCCTDNTGVLPFASNARSTLITASVVASSSAAPSACVQFPQQVSGVAACTEPLADVPQLPYQPGTQSALMKSTSSKNAEQRQRDLDDSVQATVQE